MQHLSGKIVALLVLTISVPAAATGRPYTASIDQLSSAIAPPGEVVFVPQAPTRAGPSDMAANTPVVRGPATTGSVLGGTSRPAGGPVRPSGPSFGFDDNMADADEVDDDPVSTVVQEAGALAGGSTVTVVQEGPNTSFVRQDGASNTVDVSQIGGADNSSSVIQGLFGTSNQNAISVTQQGGDGNDSVVEQNALSAGINNRITVLQAGSNNRSTLTQNGSGNFASVIQAGGEVSVLTQSGTNNTATVVQGSPRS